MTSARHAARYIGRYMARPALAEHKITNYDGEEVTFWYIDHKTEVKVTEAIPAKEFIQRLIDHIPLKGFKMVRHYGLYSRRTKTIAIEILMDCKRFIQKTFEFMKSDSRSLSWRERLVQSFGKDPLTCPNCKEKMFLWRIWHPDYGDIFDLSRDGPFVESKSKQECNKRNSSGRQVKWIPQLLPF
ncbi:MAG: transposase [Candidatus Electrothrix aestuarii]